MDKEIELIVREHHDELLRESVGVMVRYLRNIDLKWEQDHNISRFDALRELLKKGVINMDLFLSFTDAILHPKAKVSIKIITE